MKAFLFLDPDPMDVPMPRPQPNSRKSFRSYYPQYPNTKFYDSTKSFRVFFSLKIINLKYLLKSFIFLIRVVALFTWAIWEFLKIAKESTLSPVMALVNELVITDAHFIT